jgi:hypothetical protein
MLLRLFQVKLALRSAFSGSLKVRMLLEALALMIASIITVSTSTSHPSPSHMCNQCYTSPSFSNLQSLLMPFSCHDCLVKGNSRNVHCTISGLARQKTVSLVKG